MYQIRHHAVQHMKEKKKEKNHDTQDRKKEERFIKKTLCLCVCLILANVHHLLVAVRSLLHSPRTHILGDLIIQNARMQIKTSKMNTTRPYKYASSKQNVQYCCYCCCFFLQFFFHESG